MGEVLSIILTKENKERLFSDVILENSKTEITCLQFADDIESINQLFLACSLAIRCGCSLAHRGLKKRILNDDPIFSLNRLLNLMAGTISKKVWMLVVAASLWSIWLARNQVVFLKQKQAQKIMKALIMIRVNTSLLFTC